VWQWGLLGPGGLVYKDSAGASRFLNLSKGGILYNAGVRDNLFCWRLMATRRTDRNQGVKQEIIEAEGSKGQAPGEGFRQGFCRTYSNVLVEGTSSFYITAEHREHRGKERRGKMELKGSKPRKT